ncbi:MAG: hypothetical protein WCF84_18525 [Anaerolineae bacterium]
MSNITLYPDRAVMESFLKQGATCLECDAPGCNEMTPEGMDVCADLPFWNGRPVTRTMLLEWQAMLQAQNNGKN